MPPLNCAQRSEEWLAARRGKITASVAAGCLGLDPYMSRAAAWRKINDLGGDVNNRHVRWGVEFEGSARLDYEATTGNIVSETGFWVHDSLPWLGASPDGLVGTDGLVEIKCPTNAPAAVPLHHRIQCLIQLAVTGRQWCDYYAWTHGGTFLVRVHRAGIAGLIRKLTAFHEAFVVTGIEPPAKKRRKKAKNGSAA